MSGVALYTAMSASVDMMIVCKNDDDDNKRKLYSSSMFASPTLITCTSQAKFLQPKMLWTAGKGEGQKCVPEYCMRAVYIFSTACSKFLQCCVNDSRQRKVNQQQPQRRALDIGHPHVLETQPYRYHDSLFFFFFTNWVVASTLIDMTVYIRQPPFILCLSARLHAEVELTIQSFV